ncbi:MAG TPA: hypothetical protein VNM68_06490 [Candidatus Polarisedimenticolia bacterium]|nr:hypothetical protein [Candidatus Polarisedimenticolia bacterium]
MKRLSKLLLAFLLLLGLNGCIEAEYQGQATQLVEQWHNAFKAGDMDTAFSLYDKGFLADHPRITWEKKLLGLTQSYGALKEIRPTFQRKDPSVAGDYYVFGFILVFEKGSASETLTVFKSLKDDKLSIAGQTIQPKARSQ